MMLKHFYRTILIALVFCSSTWAVTYYWEPKAADIPEIRTFDFSPITAASSTTVTIDVSGTNLLVVSIGTTSGGSTTTIADATYDSLRSSGTGANINSDETRTVGGQSVPQLAEWEFSISGDVITATARVPGRSQDIGMTYSGTGTITETSVQSATGKHFFSNADNWNPAGGPPGSGDSLIYQDSDVDCRYGFPTVNFEPAGVNCLASFTGELGLPLTNRDSPNFPYPEWRATELLFELDLSATPEVRIGRGTGPGSRRLRFSCDGVTTDFIVYQTGAAPSATESAVTIRQEDATLGAPTLTFFRGSVNVQDMSQIQAINIGTPGANNSLANVRFDSCQAVSAEVTNIHSGTVFYECFFNTSGTVNIYGGNVTLATFQDALNINGGTVTAASTDSVRTISTLTITNDGVMDFSGDSVGWTVTDTNLYSGSTLLDPNGLNTWTNDIDLENCGLTDVTLNVGGKHFVINVSGTP